MDEAVSLATDESVDAPLPGVATAAAPNDIISPRVCFAPTPSVDSSPSKRLRSQSLTHGDISTNRIVQPVICPTDMDEAVSLPTDGSVDKPLPGVPTAAAPNDTALPRVRFAPTPSVASPPSKRLRSKCPTHGDISINQIVPPPIHSPMADSSPRLSHGKSSVSTVFEKSIRAIDIDDLPY